MNSEKKTKRFSKKDYEEMAKLSGNWEIGERFNYPAPRNKGAIRVKGSNEPITDESIEKDLEWLYEKMDEDGVLD